MQNRELLLELLSAEDETAVISVLTGHGLLADPTRWHYLGNMPNNQSIVLNQQSTAAAALVEKFTNSIDAILLRHCKAKGVNPRGPDAPPTMAKATELFFGDLEEKTPQEIRIIAEEHIVFYATGSKARPSLSLYDAGEGQLAENFPATFCSLISGTADGSYKGAIPFVQGRFNMGGTGVLPFCSEKYKLQLIVSRVPNSVAKSGDHEWAFTLLCFFPSKQNPSWKYLVGTDGTVLTAGSAPLGLVPKRGAKSGELCAPREREVPDGTLVKMYDFKAARSNICGEQFKRLQDYLLQPALPLRLIECRGEYQANVMGVTIWDRLEAWGKDRLEEGFEDGASISIELDTGEIVPAEVRVFKATKISEEDENLPQTGLRALINGQSHAKRDANFFRTKAVDKEHIAGSMLVTLDCTDLGQDSRNALFMSNRETFREDPLLVELFKKLQKELKDHEGLKQLNLKRYEEKVKSAVDDEVGISALEDLLSNDPTLAELFGSNLAGKVAATTADKGTNKPGPSQLPFEGKDFPTFIRRKDGATTVDIEVHKGDVTRVSFLTDMKNNYFSRRKLRGSCQLVGDFAPTYHPFNGRLTFTCSLDKNLPVGSTHSVQATITDKLGSGPFVLTINAVVLPAVDKVDPPEKPPVPPVPKSKEGPSRPDVKEADNGPEAPPLTIEKIPTTGRLQLILNTTCQLLVDAKKAKRAEDEAAVAFVFKYGLALVAMGLLEHVKKTDEWAKDEIACRSRIQEAVAGVARVIVPLCLSLPQKLPKAK